MCSNFSTRHLAPVKNRVAINELPIENIITNGIFDDPRVPIVNGPASAPNPVAALARFIRTCEALLLRVKSCNKARPVAP